MNLPTDPKERLKLGIMILLGTALVILGVIHGVINPLVKARRNKEARLRECEEGLERARNEIRAAARSLDRRMEVIQEIKQVSDRHILHPVLGNYLLEGSALLEQYARTVQVPIDPVQEIGISEIPGMSEAVKAYGLRISLQASMHDAVKLIRDIEQDNPYASVTAVIMRGQPTSNPEKHAVVIEIQYPVWADPDMPERFEEQLEEARQTGGTTV